MNWQTVDPNGLDSFDAGTRRRALEDAAARDGTGPAAPPARPGHNLHAHTFFSYNSEGYSPTHVAWRAAREGLEFAGCVDFDVLDALDEFLDACARLDLRGLVSLESRVFVPEFADRVINSPGEPGIAYNMGAGFTSVDLPEEARAFLADMKARAARRTRDVMERVNAFLDPVVLDYERDVLPLTPQGNATERHLCLAYARKAAARFGAGPELGAFWAGKLGVEPAALGAPDGAKLQNAIRAKTMKQGGVGYVAPGPGSFPLMADMNRFSLAGHAVPTVAWLDGESAGEQAMAELLAVARASGAAALNIIPDRNFTPGKQDRKLQNLYDVVALAERLHFPIMVGTEMNSPGQRFVDNFGAAELEPLLPVFRRGAAILYAHGVLQRRGGLGYLSPWAWARFADVPAKNEFYHEAGRRLRPSAEARLAGLNDTWAPSRMLDALA